MLHFCGKCQTNAYERDGRRIHRQRRVDLNVEMSTLVVVSECIDEPTVFMNDVCELRSSLVMQ